MENKKISFLEDKFREMLLSSGGINDLEELEDDGEYLTSMFLCFVGGWEVCEKHLIEDFNKQKLKCLNCGKDLKCRVDGIEIERVET